jgi:hypothetical protein
MACSNNSSSESFGVNRPAFLRDGWPASLNDNGRAINERGITTNRRQFDLRPGYLRTTRVRYHSQAQASLLGRFLAALHIGRGILYMALCGEDWKGAGKAASEPARPPKRQKRGSPPPARKLPEKTTTLEEVPATKGVSSCEQR